MKNLCENQTFLPTITMASHSSKHRWLCLSASLWRSEDMERDGVSIFPPSSIPYCLSAEQCGQCWQCEQCWQCAQCWQQCVFTKWWHIPRDETDGRPGNPSHQWTIPQLISASRVNIPKWTPASPDSPTDWNMWRLELPAWLNILLHWSHLDWLLSSQRVKDWLKGS